MIYEKKNNHHHNVINRVGGIFIIVCIYANEIILEKTERMILISFANKNSKIIQKF
jgi:hypothetical protein